MNDPLFFFYMIDKSRHLKSQSSLYLEFIPKDDSPEANCQKVP